MQMHGGHGASWCRYGLTETSPVLTVRRKGYRHNVRGTIGKGPACVFKHSHAPDLMLSLAGCCDQPSCAAERPRGPTHPPTHPHITHTHTPRARAQPLTPPHSHPTPASTPTCCVPRAATGPAIPGTELRIVGPCHATGCAGRAAGPHTCKRSVMQGRAPTEPPISAVAVRMNE